MWVPETQNILNLKRAILNQMEVVVPKVISGGEEPLCSVTDEGERV